MGTKKNTRVASNKVGEFRKFLLGYFNTLVAPAFDGHARTTSSPPAAIFNGYFDSGKSLFEFYKVVITAGSKRAAKFKKRECFEDVCFTLAIISDKEINPGRK